MFDVFRMMETAIILTTPIRLIHNAIHAHINQINLANNESLIYYWPLLVFVIYLSSLMQPLSAVRRAHNSSDQFNRNNKKKNATRTERTSSAAYAV